MEESLLVRDDPETTKYLAALTTKPGMRAVPGIVPAHKAWTYE